MKEERMAWATRLLTYLDSRTRRTLWLATVVTIIILGVTDYLTGYELSFAFFYLLPVSLASWSLGKTAGWSVSLLCAAIWQISNLLAGEQLSSQLLIFWNAGTRLGFFLVISSLLSESRARLRFEIALSRTDPLTGLANRRAIVEIATAELGLTRRYARPLTFALLDIDDFKAVNDSQGHGAGDRLLVRVAQRLKQELRDTDLVARLGGDEYVVLLPEMNEAAARTVLPRLQRALVDDLAKSSSPVTISMGVLVCSGAPTDAQDLIHRADVLMYAAKRAGKNCIHYGCYLSGLEHNPTLQVAETSSGGT